MQVYASIGYIIYTHSGELTINNPIILLDSFRAKGCELFSRKNADYGDAFANYGIVGIMVRMGDKIARINSLSRNKRQVGDESIADTFIDLYNYCIMALILLCDSIEENKIRIALKKSIRKITLRRDLESAKLRIMKS